MYSKYADIYVWVRSLRLQALTKKYSSIEFSSDRNFAPDRVKLIH
jgi:hypothetical protein